jgi:aminoethylphosphonate catabolism LysR family transcriptional regulator
MMNQARLRAFHAVLATGSFTRAAAELRVSQPAVTMQVRALEDAYGVELFRRGRRIEPTELGRELGRLTQKMLGIEEEAHELLTAGRELKHGKLRVGADAPYHVIRLLAAFHEQHPSVQIALSLGNSVEVLRDLLEARTDVAVVAEIEPDPRLFAVVSGRHRLIAFVAKGHPLAGRGSIRLRDLHGVPMILREEASITRRTLEAALRERGVVPKVVMEIESREAVREAVAWGLGVGVVSEAELGHDARLAPLRFADAKLENSESIVCLEDRRKLGLLRAFLALGSAPAAKAPATAGATGGPPRRPRAAPDRGAVRRG